MALRLALVKFSATASGAGSIGLETKEVVHVDIGIAREQEHWDTRTEQSDGVHLMRLTELYMKDRPADAGSLGQRMIAVHQLRVSWPCLLGRDKTRSLLERSFRRGTLVDNLDQPASDVAEQAEGTE